MLSVKVRSIVHHAGRMAGKQAGRLSPSSRFSIAVMAGSVLALV